MTKSTVTMELTIPGGNVIDVEVTVEGSISPPDPSVGYGGSVEDLAIVKVEGSSRKEAQLLDDYLSDVIWEVGDDEQAMAYDAHMEAKAESAWERQRGL